MGLGARSDVGCREGRSCRSRCCTGPGRTRSSNQTVMSDTPRAIVTAPNVPARNGRLLIMFRPPVGSQICRRLAYRAEVIDVSGTAAAPSNPDVLGHLSERRHG